MLRTTIFGLALLTGVGFARADEPIVVTYSVADLFVTPTMTIKIDPSPKLVKMEQEPDFQPLIQLVRSTVASAGREDVTIRADRSSASLVIRARESDHNLISDRLEQWRRTLDVQVVLERHSVSATQGAWQEVVQPALADARALRESMREADAATPTGWLRAARGRVPERVAVPSERMATMLASLKTDSRAGVTGSLKATLFNGQTARFVDGPNVQFVQPVVSVDRRSIRLKTARRAGAPLDVFATTETFAVPDGQALVVEEEPAVDDGVPIRRLLILVPRIHVVEEDEELVSGP